MGQRDSHLDGWDILNITLDDADWTNITFPVFGVKYFDIQEQSGTLAVDFRKSDDSTDEWRIRAGMSRPCYRDNRDSKAGGQVKRVSATETTVQIYYEY